MGFADGTVNALHVLLGSNRIKERVIWSDNLTYSEISLLVLTGRRLEGDSYQHVGIDGDGAARFEVFPRGADDRRVQMIFAVEDGHEVVKEVEKRVVDEWPVAQHGAVVGVLSVTEAK